MSPSPASETDLLAEASLPLGTPPTTTEPREVAAPRRRRPSLGLGLGIGMATLYLSLVVLIPLAAVVWRSQEDGWDAFWTAVTSPLQPCPSPGAAAFTRKR